MSVDMTTDHIVLETIINNFLNNCKNMLANRTEQTNKMTHKKKKLIILLCGLEGEHCPVNDSKEFYKTKTILLSCPFRE